VPEEFNVEFLARAAEPGVILGSKAVGEPPLMLAISVREAIRDAIRAYAPGSVVTFDSPATPERVYFAIQSACGHSSPLAAAAPAPGTPAEGTPAEETRAETVPASAVAKAPAGAVADRS
jgi:xanthine dehydrogenase large subunit